MILSDRDIFDRVEKWEIKISWNKDFKNQIHASSMDLRLWKYFKIYKHSSFPYLDPKQDYSWEDVLDLIEVEEWKPFIVQPWEFLLWATKENITLPNDLVARVEWRSSIWRLWIIIHTTAGFVDAGFSGTITLEIWNLNKMPVAIYPGQRICQLAFEQMSSEAKVPYWKKSSSKYQGQVLPQESKIFIDKDF